MKKMFIVLFFVFFLTGVVSGAEIFNNGFDSLAEISSEGVIEGSSSIVSGVQGNAAYLPGSSAVRFNAIDIPNSGVLEFWV